MRARSHPSRLLPVLLLALCCCTEDAVVEVDGGSCPATCPGCCAGSICHDGKREEACGHDGLTCLRCAEGDICSAGECLPPEGRCGPGNCASGCCQATRCVEGTAHDACGNAAAPCQRCSSTQACVDQHCRCGARSCDGCCDGDTCRRGSEHQACGSEGQPCRPCGERQICSEGSCVDNDCGQCDGCCDGTSCRPGDSSAQCGRGGRTCKPCDTGELCTQGVCNDPSRCGPGLCGGCCADSACQDGDALLACGSSGVICAECRPGEICDAGSCKSDPAALWALSVVEATIDPTKNWDTLVNTAPDPYVTISVGAFEESTSVLNNNYRPLWEELLGVLSADQIATWNLTITVYDDDTLGEELMGACVTAVPPEVMIGGLARVEGCPHPDGPTYVQELVLRFTPR